jgi:hypothetical protein
MGRPHERAGHQSERTLARIRNMDSTRSVRMTTATFITGTFGAEGRDLTWDTKTSEILCAEGCWRWVSSKLGQWRS